MSFRTVLVGGAVAIVAAACSLDFDALDPRVGGQGPGGAATTASSSASTTASSSGTTGGGGSGPGGAGGTGGTGGATPLGPFTNVQPIAGVNTNEDEDDPSLTDDLLELYFNSDRDGPVNLYVASRASAADPWGPPALITSLATAQSETNCEVSGDGLTLWFTRRVSNTTTQFDIYRTERSSRTESWPSAVIVAELNSSMNDFFGRTTDDGLYLLMSSSRSSADNLSDIFEATRATNGGPWSTPSPVSALAQTGTESEVWLSGNGLEAWFTRVTNTTQGDDIYRSVRASTNDPWPSPSPVPELNTALNDADVHLAPDLRYVVFSRGVDSSERDLFEAHR